MELSRLPRLQFSTHCVEVSGENSAGSVSARFERFSWGLEDFPRSAWKIWVSGKRLAAYGLPSKGRSLRDTVFRRIVLGGDAFR